MRFRISTTLLTPWLPRTLDLQSRRITYLGLMNLTRLFFLKKCWRRHRWTRVQGYSRKLCEQARSSILSNWLKLACQWKSAAIKKRFTSDSEKLAPYPFVVGVSYFELGILRQCFAQVLSKTVRHDKEVKKVCWAWRASVISFSSIAIAWSRSALSPKHLKRFESMDLNLIRTRRSERWRRSESCVARL